jgi:hypothetical protein
MQFRKDGSTVGSIGVDAGDNLYIGSTAANHGGIYMNDTGVLPMSAGSVTDGTRGLGGASNRWKDLYLSGGAYLGGTAAANKLDDYEEGTWTPTYTTDATDFGSVTYSSITSGRYTKIGNTVHLTGVLYTSAITLGSASGSVRIGNLPFSVAASSVGQNSYIPLCIGEVSGFAGDYPSGGRTVPSTTVMDVNYRTAANGTTTGLTPADFNTGGSGNLIRFSVFYVT